MPIIVRFLLTVMSVLLLTGCWSSQEIEDLSLGVWMAFDTSKKLGAVKKISN